MRHQTYSYLPRRRVSLPLDRYQIILLGGRSTCVNNLPKFVTWKRNIRDSNPGPFESQVQRSNHYATWTHRSLYWLKITKRIECKLLSLTYKVLTTNQPSRLHNHLAALALHLWSYLLVHLHHLLYEQQIVPSSVLPHVSGIYSRFLTVNRGVDSIYMLLLLFGRPYLIGVTLENWANSTKTQSSSFNSCVTEFAAIYIISPIRIHPVLRVALLPSVPSTHHSSSVVSSLFHSGLKTFLFCQSFPLYLSFSSSGQTPQIPQTV